MTVNRESKSADFKFRRAKFRRLLTAKERDFKRGERVRIREQIPSRRAVIRKLGKFKLRSRDDFDDIAHRVIVKPFDAGRIDPRGADNIARGRE